MSGAAEAGAALDPASRAVARWFALRLGMLASFALLPCLAGARSLHDGAGLLSFACSLGGTISMLTAACRRQPMGQGPLNAWDESLAFIAASRLAHLAMAMQA